MEIASTAVRDNTVYSNVIRECLLGLLAAASASIASRRSWGSAKRCWLYLPLRDSCTVPRDCFVEFVVVVSASEHGDN